MNLLNLIKILLGSHKFIDVKKLPSMGLFYKEDFEIFINKATSEDIEEYEKDFNKKDIGLVITKIKKVVEKNTTLSKGYSFSDIKSIDVVFIFLEIVTMTNGRKIIFNYQDEITGKDETLAFSSETFNYVDINQNVMNLYDSKNKQFVISDYKFSLPSIGVENSLTSYLISISDRPDIMKYSKYNYDFTFFLGDKNEISHSEVENLIQIFNFDIEDSEKKKVKKIVTLFQPLQRYSLKKGDKVIEINSQLELETIWKNNK
jgi:hypothetical protein